MGLVTLDLPVVGQPNTSEDIKVRNNFQTLQNTINGNIDTPNLTPGLLASLGSNRQAASALQVREVGEVGQIRAGRVLTPADFTNMGLSAPIALWNLGNVNDSSGNARNLTNKGAVTFDTGITGSASEAAKFTGSTAQAFYLADTGAADPFRIKTGSWGCWFRTAKRGVQQVLVSKYTAASRGFHILIDTTNTARGVVSVTGAADLNVQGTTDVADDRWHFVVATHDGTFLQLYIDGTIEAFVKAEGSIFSSVAPLNVGGYGADGATATTLPHFGRVDEAFISSDVLSDDEVRNLYCAVIGHSLGSIPSGSRLSVRRRRRGSTFAVSSFPATPTRLYNFSAAALTDEGSNAVGLTSNPGTGAIISVVGADGSSGNGYSLSGAHTGLSATDAGLPSALASRSYGAWFKTSMGTVGDVVSWGTVLTNDARLGFNANGTVQSASGADGITGPVLNDGLWHFGVVVEDNTSVDGVKRKLYIDGQLVGGSTVLTSLTLAGANRFRVGAAPDGTRPYTGQTDGVFVYAGALTPEQVRVLYNVAAQQLALSPASHVDYIEAFETARLLATFDTIEGTDFIDLTVIS